MDSELDQLHWMLFTLRTLNNAPMLRSGWLRQLLPQLDPTEREHNALVGDIFGPVLAESQPWPLLEQFTARLAADEASQIQARILRRIAAASGLDAARLLAEPAAFMRSIKALNPGWSLDLALGQRAQQLLHDPDALQALLVQHLEQMWQRYLAPQWAQAARLVEPARLVESAAALEQAVAALDPQVVTRVQALALAGPVRVMAVLELAPMPQTLRADGVTWLAVTPQRSAAQGSVAPPTRVRDVGRSELLVRLRAMADPIRLDILALVQAQGETGAQEIISQLEMPQSSISRHLSVLAASGFLRERRASGARKVYQAVPEQLEATMRVVAQWLDGTLPAETPLPPLETPLQRFLNAAGSLVSWPAAQAERRAALERLAGEFTVGRRYSEAEVNGVLRRHPAMDAAYLRRALIGAGLLERESDGSAYWCPVQR